MNSTSVSGIGHKQGDAQSETRTRTMLPSGDFECTVSFLEMGAVPFHYSRNGVRGCRESAHSEPLLRAQSRTESHTPHATFTLSHWYGGLGSGTLPHGFLGGLTHHLTLWLARALASAGRSAEWK